MIKGSFSLSITCALDKQYFVPWFDLTEEQQDRLLEGDEANCAGEDDRMGYWCHTCSFCIDIESSDLSHEPFPKCNDCGEVWLDHVCP